MAAIAHLENQTATQEEIVDAAAAGDVEKLRALLTSTNSSEYTLPHKLLRDPNGFMQSWNKNEISAIFRSLRAAGVDPNTLDEDGRSALSLVINDVDQPYMPRLLVEVMGVDPNLPVTFNQCLECVFSERMMNEPFDILMDELGCTPPRDGRYTHLLFSSEEKEGCLYEYILEKLLNLGLIVTDERDNNMDTPLHRALMPLNYPRDGFSRKTRQQADEEEIEYVEKLAKLLLSHGADPLAENSDGQTPLDVWNADKPVSIPGDTDDVEEVLRNTMADAIDRLNKAKWDAFMKCSSAQRLGAHICIELLGPLVTAPSPRGLICQRRTILVDMLDAEGIVADGRYYEDCLRGVEDIDMAEFRLRHYIATTGAPEYERIVQKLKNTRGGGRYFSGIHAVAREKFEAILDRRGICFECPLDACVCSDGVDSPR